MSSARIGLIVSTWLAAHAVQAAIVIDGSTVDWTPITYPGVQSDYLSDQQTGITELDIVGSADGSHPGIYTQFFNGGDDTSLTDGEIAFRFRVGEDKNPAYFQGVAWIGMDVNADGALDLFAGVENPKANQWIISIRDAGSDLNTSPSTTSISASSLFSYDSVPGTFDFSPVSLVNDPSATNLDLDGGGKTDYFVSFKLPFADLVSAVNTLVPGTGFDETKGIAYVAATAQNDNTLNADLNGVQADTNSAVTWEVLGAISPELTAYGTPIPEPSVYAGLLGVCALLLAARRRHGRLV